MLKKRYTYHVKSVKKALYLCIGPQFIEYFIRNLTIWLKFHWKTIVILELDSAVLRGVAPQRLTWDISVGIDRTAPLLVSACRLGAGGPSGVGWGVMGCV